MSTGAVLIAKTLKALGVTVAFGIIGIPIVEVGDALIDEGIKFITFRNEQAASYAASAYGYLTGKPGVLLVVGGPGIIHALPGVFNSNSNRWPLLVIAGSSSFNDINKGGFQELDQISLLTPMTKFAARPLNLNQVPQFFYKAYKTSFFGTPGSTYIDIPADLVEYPIVAAQQEELLKTIKPILPENAPKFRGDSLQIAKVANLLKSSKNILVVVGKGAAYANASKELRNFVEKYNLPFLPTPMGKGVIPDDSPLNVSSARSLALKYADVVLLLGARLNWILHFGEVPRFKENVKFVQVDNHSEDIGENSPFSLEYGIVGDLAMVTEELDLKLANYRGQGIPKFIQDEIQKNTQSLLLKENTRESQLNYNNVYKVIRDIITPIDSKIILVSEGANTMDIARISFPQNYSKQRIDAGTNATMGVGLGYAIASKASNLGKIVVAIEGDSAFGFSGLEIETAVRSKLPIIVILMNNSGVYHGTDDHQYGEFKTLPSTALSKDTRYDILAKSLGAEGYLVKDEQSLSRSFKLALDNYEHNISTLINVIISPGKVKKIGFGWQNKQSAAKL
ncbi:hypothetical protein WICMUC_002547 [Wickerhamomyces mucosus]|uniref:2-hydroxyacyl-CoA lyase n=1 Tax=Wickerhamomyces mucosus TaxID=1378264 RepID=A0A9P8PQB7_9ASCO|nr:hypothetical protein WICMUC_002547 [Wickerhamomyces mucosus]